MAIFKDPAKMKEIFGEIWTDMIRNTSFWHGVVEKKMGEKDP